jgi:xylan 1,4-beta-xylosidase
VGGPDIAGTNDTYLSAFMAHVKEAGTPTDFLSFHAKGSPIYVDDGGGKGHVRMGMATHLAVADRQFAQIEADPHFRGTPIIIGESDPEGCAACQGPANAYRNGTMYSSYTAASFPRLQDLANRRHLNLEGILTWAFEFEDQPYFAGFRQLTSAGVDLPVMNVFKMFSKMGGEYIAATSDHQIPLDEVMNKGVREAADVGVVATMERSRIAILVWHYHDDDLPGPEANIRLNLRGLPRAFAKEMKLTHYRVDRDHSNSYAAWLAMGSPIAPSDSQREALLKAAQLSTPGGTAQRVSVDRNRASLDFHLPRQGVSLLLLEAP